MSDAVNKTSSIRVLQTAFVVAFACALLVSLAAVSLRPYYLANLEAERMARLNSILEALEEMTGGELPALEARVVELETGNYTDAVDADSYDARRDANNPSASVAIPDSLDVAGLKRRARYAVVYLIGDSQSGVDGLILPVRGVGYQSALYAYLALTADGREVLALRFYEQGETPGLGSRIQDPAWEAQWPGMSLYSSNDELTVDFDAISGATRTSIGVERMLQFWLGEFGFGPYLQRLRSGEI